MISLTPEQLADLEQAGRTLAELQKEIDRAESAGLDVADLRDRLNEVERLRQGMMRVYGTGRHRSRVS